MQRRKAKWLVHLLAFGLVAAVFSGPTYAVTFQTQTVSFQKHMVNDTGQDQMGVVVVLHGPVLITDMESEPFRQAQIVYSTSFLGEMLTEIHFFDADGIGRPIPGTTGPASVVTLGFSIAADELELLGIYWVDASGNPTADAM